MAFGKRETIRWFNFFICFAVSVGALAYAYISAIIGTTLGKPAFLVFMGVGNAKGAVFPDKENVVGAITSVFQVGAVVGCLASTVVNDKWGRKAGMVYCALLSILGSAGLTASQNITSFIVFRFFAGAGSWGFLAVATVYGTELAPPAYRGFFVGMTGTMIGLGYATANYFGLAFYYNNNKTVGWRAPLGLALVFPVIVLATLPFLPESPRYLLMKGRNEEAWKVVEKLHKDPNDPDDAFARGEFYQMKQQAVYDKTVPSSWYEMFRRPSYRKRVMFAMLYTFLDQSTGVLVINNYEPIFYEKLGFSSKDSLILQTGRNSIAFLGNLIAALLMDRVGRRKLVLTGIIGCLASLSVYTAMVALYADEGTNKAGLGVGVCALYVFLAFFAIGLDAAGWVLISEIFPNFIRAKGFALSVASQSIADIIYLQVTPQGFANLGWKYLMVYISISILSVGWYWWATPETSGLPLEEIAALFGDKDDIVVYQREIHVDRNTHKLVVEKQGEGEDTFTREVTEGQKNGSTHREIIEEQQSV